MNIRKADSRERALVDQIIQDCNEIYQEREEIIHHARRVRSMRIRTNVPRSFQKVIGDGVRAPLSWSHVQTVVGMIAKNRPTFQREPRFPREKEACQRLVNSAGALWDSFEREAKRPLIFLFADQLAGDGLGVLKTRVLPWEGMPIQQEGESDSEFNKRYDSWAEKSAKIPIRVSLVDPLLFMPAREEDSPSYVVEKGKRNIKATLSRFGLSYGVNNKILLPSELPRGRAVSALEMPRGLGPTVDVEEVWTPSELYLRIGRTEHFVFENPLGFIPYVWRGGEQTSIPDPSLETTSSIYPFLNIEPWVNTLLSVMVAWSILGGTPILWTARDSGGASDPRRFPISDIPLGKRIDLGTGGKIGFVSPPEVGQGLSEVAQTLLNMYERAGMTPLARGLIGTRTPGLTLSAALEAATDRLRPVIFSLEEGIAETTGMVWRIIDQVVKQPVYVLGNGVQKGPLGVGKKQSWGKYVIDPKDIDGYYECKVDIKLASLQDLISQGMHAAFMKSHKLWSADRGMRFSGVDDPAGERAQILIEEFMENPAVKAFLMKSAIEDEPQLSEVAAAFEQTGEQYLSALMQASQLQPQEEEGFYGGAPQPRGGPAPQAGGRSAGSPRRPTGPRPVKQGRQNRTAY